MTVSVADNIMEIHYKAHYKVYCKAQCKAHSHKVPLHKDFLLGDIV